MKPTNNLSGRQIRPAVKPTDYQLSVNPEPETATAPLLLTIPEASAALRSSRWMLYRLIHTRRLETVKIGRRRYVPVSALRAFVDQLTHSEAA